MTRGGSPSKVTPAQVRWFRLRRSGLVDPFRSPEETARRLIGVQAQLPPAAALAFWNRTRGTDAAKLAAARLEKRTLVRFWGQRNTVHTYAAQDWPFLHAAFAERASIMHKRLEKSGLRGEFERLARRIAKRLEAGEHLTYKDVRSTKLEGAQDKWVVAYVVFMQLVRWGITCHGPERGKESGFVHRQHWLPDLDWSPPDPEEAYPRLAERYLAAYGPAEVRDLAFWYDTTQANARRWIGALGDRVCEVDTGGRPHFVLSADEGELAAKPPPASRWPVRLLYRFDPLVLATKDKSQLIDEEHYKKVWRPSAHVEAVVLVHGRIAGTWRYERKARTLRMHLAPFAPLSARVAREVNLRATHVAGFFGLKLET